MDDRCLITPALPLDTTTPGAATMGPWRSWWSLLCLVPVDAAAGMPMASFFHTMVSLALTFREQSLRM